MQRYGGQRHRGQAWSNGGRQGTVRRLALILALGCMVMGGAGSPGQAVRADSAPPPNVTPTPTPLPQPARHASK